MSYWYNFNSDNLAQKFDETVPWTTYIGYTSQNGLNTSGAIRYIKKIIEVWWETTILRAWWRLAFDQIWDDRAWLNYS